MRKPGQLISRRLRAGAWTACLIALLASSCLSQPADEESRSPLDVARRVAAEGRVKQAVEILDRLSASGHRTPELFDLRAQFALALGDERAAERDWSRAAQMDPTHARSRLALARMHGRRGLWPDAVALYREVLLTQPRNADAILGLSEAYEQMGRTVGARELIEAANEVIDDRRIQERWVRMALAGGRPEEAERALKRVAESVEGLARRDVLVRLAELYLSADRADDALAAAREALSIERLSGPVTVPTYDALALAIDHEIEQIAQGLQRTLDELNEGSLSREEAFGAIESSRTHLKEIESLVAEIAPPGQRRSANASRLFAYALVSEAALNALAHVDLGLDDRLEAYNTRLTEARTEMRRLAAKPAAERVGRGAR